MKTVMTATLLLISGVAVAQTAPEAPQPTEQPAKEKKTCRSMTATGSFMATRVCNTAAAWRAFDGYTADGAQQTRDAYRMSVTSSRMDRR
ncbi:hypothetical protein FSB78_11545 [Sphingomonas ginsenosidivorax]|uniref:Uncharacterized protein n=1 Tax=Sphingomonas ginsenosidivorax TaxID=862135 RepID=A0A5C6UH43_9SPHN|nr:hypothetical protein [Sphingomonas ginsenosidivorax]TXC71506.1 hypothetical protein FSB78_11545 [Sphingomonas ginsenosidivorax]